MALWLAKGWALSLRCISTGKPSMRGSCWCGHVLNVELSYRLRSKPHILSLFSGMLGKGSSLGSAGAAILCGQSQMPPSCVVAQQIDPMDDGPADISVLFFNFLERFLFNFCWNFPTAGKSRIIILVGASSHIIGSRILRQDWHIYHGAEWRCTLRATCSCYVGKKNSAIRISALLLALVNEQQEIGQALQSDHSRTDSGTMCWTVHKCQKSPLHLKFWLVAYPMPCVGWIWDGLWVEHVSIQPCRTLALTDDRDMIEMWERIGRELLLIKEICPGLPDLAWLTLLASLLAFAVLFLAGVRTCVGFAIPSSEFLWKNKWCLFAIRPVISSGFVDGTRGRGMVFTWSNNSTFFAFRW